MRPARSVGVPPASSNLTPLHARVAGQWVEAGHAKCLATRRLQIRFRYVAAGRRAQQKGGLRQRPTRKEATLYGSNCRRCASVG